MSGFSPPCLGVSSAAGGEHSFFLPTLSALSIRAPDSFPDGGTQQHFGAARIPGVEAVLKHTGCLLKEA